MASAFHLVSLPLDNEEQTLEAALAALGEMDAGETVFFSEAVAWTAARSGVAYARLVRAAREKDVNIVATLNLGGELAEDLPGKKPNARYHALVVFTRHNHVHVPQAKILPDAIELRGGLTDDALPVEAYTRSNLVRFDIDEQIVEIRFFIGADVAVLSDHSPRELACDVVVAPMRLPIGAEDKVRLTLGDARKVGVSSTSLCINGHAKTKARVVCEKLEDAADNGRRIAAKASWLDKAQMTRRLWRYAAAKKRQTELVTEIDRLARDPKRRGRVPLFVPAKTKVSVELGVYPVLIAM